MNGSSESGSSSGGMVVSTGGLATTTLETTTMTMTSEPGMTTGPGTTGPVTTGEATEMGTTEAPIDTCEDHPATDACCCFGKDGGYQTNDCPETELCPTVAIVCTSDDEQPDCPEGALTVDPEADLTCALDALASGMPGVIRYTIDSQNQAGYWGQERVFYVQGDGTAFVRDFVYQDLSGVFAPLGRRMLNESSTFSKCKSEPELATRIGCLINAANAEVTEMCLDSSDVRV